MKIGKKFNQLNKSEYFHFIENHKKYTDFNTLGLYRSISENEKLELTDKLEIRDYANGIFGKTFNFYQLKDPKTYFDLITLAREMTDADERKVWEDIRLNQEKILSDKKLKHRNFGIYSKHDCGYENCPFQGLMLKKGSWFAENHMWFESDKSKGSKDKSDRVKKQRKNIHRIIKDQLEDEY